MNRLLVLTLLLAGGYGIQAQEENKGNISPKDSITTDVRPQKGNRLSIGGYGEAVASRMYYSSNYKRYTDASLYKNADSYGQFDLPHVVLNIGYDFGHGWTLGSEIEFEHGGTESAVEIEEEETGEYESEIERGGEVALEQFWLQKSICPELNIKAGHLIVPVGGTNSHHMPTEFFTVYRPEGESTILPCTWHETGISVWGRTNNWRYEAMCVAGLNAESFGSQNWIKDGAGSPYEFKMGTSVAGVARVDNYSLPHLRIGISGYIGNSAANTLKPDNYDDVDGLVTIGALDFNYTGNGLIVRGSADYGHLGDSEKLTAINKATRKDSPSPKTSIASDAVSVGLEAGYDLFRPIAQLHKRNQKCYLFGRYDYYDSMYKTEGSIIDKECWGRQKLTAGLNYKPIDQIVIKAEYSYRILKSQYNNEPTLSLGIAYSGLFN